MRRIREIAEDELETLVDVARAAQPREHATVSGFVDWRGQASGMVWLLAEDDGQTAGAGYALVGWAIEHGATELECPVSEDDGGSLAWATRYGYEEVGRNSRLVLDLTAAEAPAPNPPEGIEIVAWAGRPELAAGMYEVAREAVPDIPGCHRSGETGPSTTSPA